jgi:hypothetical protein
MEITERINIILLCCGDILSPIQLYKLDEIKTKKHLITDDNIIEKLEIIIEWISGMNSKRRRRTLKYIDMVLDIINENSEDKITKLDIYYDIVSRIRDHTISWSPEILDV